ncbi:PREDICTED: gastrula zinc finger protein XlCGF26.1-like [Papilio xuthus]|uniref:Gastrula zinc finger protein XlCGF26.1-like n=2 Tax=Papilio xuthus TaxID=66420 RepID=A0AAJ6Z0E9_PAPXU|nr:PREDICTED: gastrula zinc finger protein XlCGF26.1-like [Papilio xuthus]
MNNIKNPLNRMICVCCLSTKRSLMKLDKCKHVLFFAKILENKVNYAEMYICTFCHNFIIKVENFTRQVEKSIDMLNKYKELQSEHIHKLDMSAVEINYAINNEVLRHEYVNNTLNNDIKSEIKCEKMTSQSEDDSFSDTTMAWIEISKIEAKDMNTLDTEVKKTITNDKNDGNMSTFKNDQSHNEVKLLPQKIKKIKQTKQTSNISQKIFDSSGIKFEDKIRIVTLSQEEITGERKRDVLYEYYLKKPYKCKDCIIGFAHEHIYELHLKQKHELREGALLCDICKSYLNNDKALRNHMRQHVVRYECKECGIRKRDRNTALNHYQKHHEEILMTFICEVCGFTTDSYKNYRSHTYSHKDRVPCKICGGTFANQNVLTKHILKMHGTPEPVSCKTCDKKFKTDIQLKRHEYIHETSEPSADKFCDTCKTYFRSRRLLKLHLKNHSKHLKDADKRFTCFECGVKYSEKARLKDHVDWEHLKLRNYVCKLCSKEFETKRCMTRHIMYVHDKIKRPKNKICDLCGTGFSNLRLLESHIRTHTGERPFKCEICDKTFGFKASLYTHNRLIHKKIKRKPYPKKNN